MERQPPPKPHRSTLTKPIQFDGGCLSPVVSEGGPLFVDVMKWFINLVGGFNPLKKVVSWDYYSHV